jgi:hypothetical protein
VSAENERSAVHKWHPTIAEQEVCDSIDGGCPHDAEFIESLPWPEQERPSQRRSGE